MTLEQVDEWREQLRLLTAQSTEINKKIGELQKKLADAQPFVTEAVANTLETERSAAARPQDHGDWADVTPPASMFGAVANILRSTPGLEPKEIARTIREDASLPEKIKNSHPNYLYTALKRMTDRGLLVRDSQGRYSVPKTNEAA